MLRRCLSTFTVLALWVGICPMIRAQPVVVPAGSRCTPRGGRGAFRQRRPGRHRRPGRYRPASGCRGDRRRPLGLRPGRFGGPAVLLPVVRPVGRRGALDLRDRGDRDHLHGLWDHRYPRDVGDQHAQPTHGRRDDDPGHPGGRGGPARVAQGRLAPGDRATEPGVVAVGPPVEVVPERAPPADDLPAHRVPGLHVLPFVRPVGSRGTGGVAHGTVWG